MQREKHKKVELLKLNKMKRNIYSGLNYSTKQVNRNFRIKIAGLGINKLVGVAGLIAAVGIELANRLLQRAFECLDDVCYCKLRRGLKVSFYCK